MSKNSLESACEQYFIDLLRTDDRLKGKTIVHCDRDGDAEADAIIVEAVQGHHRLDGPRGYDVEVTVTYRAPAKVTVEQNNLVVAAISGTVFGARPLQTSSETQFDYLLLLDDSSGHRGNTQNLRKRDIKFNLIARLKSQPENVLSR